VLFIARPPKPPFNAELQSVPKNATEYIEFLLSRRKKPAEAVDNQGKSMSGSRIMVDRSSCRVIFARCWENRIMESLMHTLIQIKTSLGSSVQNLSEVGGMLFPAGKKWLIVMCGGGLGAASRYGAGLLAVNYWGAGFPYGTLMVNLVGCFLIGLLFALAERTQLLTPNLRLFLITGYLGALTTFSAFALETVNAGRAGLTLQPLINVLANTTGGLSLTLAGLWLGGLR
jgi:fluoride exporter